MVYLYAMLAVGAALMIYARLRSPSDYFALRREAYVPPDLLPGGDTTP